MYIFYFAVTNVTSRNIRRPKQYDLLTHMCSPDDTL